MKILLTGSTGYIGKRLLYQLVEKGHQVFCIVRHKQSETPSNQQVIYIQGDLHKDQIDIPKDIDAAYFLIHSMKEHKEHFASLEKQVAENFLKLISATSCKQIIYLSGLVNAPNLSPHLRSRLAVEQTLRKGPIPVTTLRAGIIIGEGSSSFEIIRDLVEKLPMMITPRWVNSKCQPIAIYDVIETLLNVLNHPLCLDKSFDIGGPDIFTYGQMLKIYAKKRNLKRWIVPIPLFSPRLSSYWLLFITSTNFSLAKNLVDSLKNDAICHEQSIQEIFPRQFICYEKALDLSLQKIAQNSVISSWKTPGLDSFSQTILKHIQAPEYGTYHLYYQKAFLGDQKTIFHSFVNRKIKTFIQGIRKLWVDLSSISSKAQKENIMIDHWQILVCDFVNSRLLLYSKKKLPGELWLTFSAKDNNFVLQISCQPFGLLGRLYWWILYPIHLYILPKLLQKVLNT